VTGEELARAEGVEAKVEEARETAGGRTPGETPGDRLWGAVFVLGFLVLLLGAVVLVLLSKVDDVETDTARTRAIGCRNLILSGAQLRDDGPCYQPEVLRFYDPLEVRPGTGVAQETRELICLDARSQSPEGVAAFEARVGHPCEVLPRAPQPQVPSGGL
jgi:hypothetical protein